LKKKKRIGVLGGTFNPPHYGHLVLAQESLKKLHLDKVIFIPTYISPHKKIRDDNAYKRYKMAALACAGNPKFEVSNIEIKKRKVSYSVNTLRELKKKYGKDAELFFITGSDSLNELESWKEVGEVLKLANFIVANRPGSPVKKLRKKVKAIEISAPDISSSMIRERVRRRLSIENLVPDSVRNFILRHKLYT
jgi:nicotinate-nucleotide adenylyltransferase